MRFCINFSIKYLVAVIVLCNRTSRMSVMRHCMIFCFLVNIGELITAVLLCNTADNTTPMSIRIAIHTLLGIEVFVIVISVCDKATDLIPGMHFRIVVGRLFLRECLIAAELLLKLKFTARSIKNTEVVRLRKSTAFILRF